MSDNSFGRFLGDDYKARHRSTEAAERRERIRLAAEAGTLEYDRDGVPLDPAGTERGTPRPRPAAQAGTEDTPPSTRRLTDEGALPGERGNEGGFAKHITGDGPTDADRGPSPAQREAESPTAGRGFGRYLH